MRLLKLWFNEPGEGKDLVDSVFNQIKTLVRNRITRSDGNMYADTLLHLAAHASMQPRPGVTLTACQMPHRRTAATTRWTWPTVSGIKRYAHIVYEDPGWQLAPAESAEAEQLPQSQQAAAIAHSAPAVQPQHAAARASRASKRGRQEAGQVATANAAAPSAAPSSAAQAIDAAALRERCEKATIPQLRSLLEQNSSKGSRQKGQLVKQVLQVHAEASGRVHGLSLLQGRASKRRKLAPGRPVRMFRSYRIGAGRQLRLSVPTCNGQAASGSYCTGAESVAIADAMPAAQLDEFNAWARQLSLQQLTPSTQATGARRTFDHIPGTRKRSRSDSDVPPDSSALVAAQAPATAAAPCQASASSGSAGWQQISCHLAPVAPAAPTACQVKRMGTAL